MKNTPRKPLGKPFGKAKRPSFGKSFGKPGEEHKASGAPSRGFKKKPHHDRHDERAVPAREGFKKKPLFGKNTAKRKSAGTSEDTRKQAMLRPKQESVTREKRPPQQKRESLHRQGVLLWGIHAVHEAWLNPKRKCYRLWITESARPSLQEALDEAAANKLARPSPLHAEKSDMEHFLPKGSVHQGVVLEAEPLIEMSLDDLLGHNDCPDIVVVLDQVTDPHNVGAIMRSAAAFGAGAVVVTERNAPSTTGIMAKTASGAAEHVPLISVVNIARALDALKAENFWCIGLAEEGLKELSGTVLSDGRIALVMGAEGDGLRRLTREHCDELARLPTGGPIGSLNVSNAAAIALYEVKRQRGQR